MHPSVDGRDEILHRRHRVDGIERLVVGSDEGVGGRELGFECWASGVERSVKTSRVADDSAPEAPADDLAVAPELKSLAVTYPLTVSRALKGGPMGGRQGV